MKRATGDPTFALSLGNDPSDMSIDGSRLMGFTCGSTTTGTPNEFIMYSATTNSVHFTIRRTGDWNRIPPWALPSGRGFYHEEGGRILNLAGAQTGSHHIANYREHAALAWGLAGYDTYNLVDFDTPAMTGSLVSYRLDTAVGHVIMGQATGWPYPKSSTHVSTGAKNGSGWVAVGQIGTATGQTELDNEIVLANVADINAIAQARA